MNIAPVNSFNSQNNKNNIGFEKIYRVKVNHNLFVSAVDKKQITDPQKILNLFLNELQSYVVSLRQIVRDGLKINTEKHGFFNARRYEKFVGENLSSLISFENPTYRKYHELAANTNCAQWWLARHLNIEEPKPASDTHHTFLITTGDDILKLNKAVSLEILKKSFSSGREIRYKVDSGEYRREDIPYYKKLAMATDKETATNNFLSKNKVEDFVINNQNDLEDFYLSINDSITYDAFENATRKKK